MQLDYRISEKLAADYIAARNRTLALTEGLKYDDFLVQTADFVSPPKWHLAHTTWFFEAFVLIPYAKNYQSPNPKYHELFNSYYESVGDRPARGARGWLSRPTLEDIFFYRLHVDETLLLLLRTLGDPEIGRAIELGIHHEQQHQELLLMDIKHIFFCNSLQPIYQRRLRTLADEESSPETNFIFYPGGMRPFGATGESFSFDNERARHEVFVGPFQLADRLVTNGDYWAFVESDGYRNPDYWLSDGWDWVKANHIEHPLYWHRHGNSWYEFTLSGTERMDPRDPLCHVSYYEAEAFARFSGARLPTEYEWEWAASEAEVRGNLAEEGALRTLPYLCPVAESPCQLFGDVWEWTGSAYRPYPGYERMSGALGEYNGKFMANQMVLRGGSFATPRSHIRASYRNFYHPTDRWQIGGLRLAKDAT